ncbi:MAG TPA: hypothetical protein VNT79_08665 [Phycisphaerae bacterium]|nr:hypothetical protein [Phycisphaerae bacterium]
MSRIFARIIVSRSLHLLSLAAMGAMSLAVLSGCPDNPPTTNVVPPLNGRDGIDCWDDGDGRPESAEDVNGDGEIDSRDCQGPGPASEVFWNEGA